MGVVGVFLMPIVLSDPLRNSPETDSRFREPNRTWFKKASGGRQAAGVSNRQTGPAGSRPPLARI
jgi:hypothetical protein